MKLFKHIYIFVSYRIICGIRLNNACNEQTDYNRMQRELIKQN